MIFERLYSTASADDQCTLFMERNLINRRNVSSDTKHNYAANKHFFVLAVQARVTAAAMTILGMQTFDGQPSNFKYHFSVTGDNKDSKKKYLKQLAAMVVDQFILDKQNCDAMLSHMRKLLEEKRIKESLLQPDGRYACKYPPCKKTFK